MQLDLQSINIQPLRHTFDHLARRFGDKPATRYQEGTYDIQQTYLYHYKPTWEPGLEIFDERRTAIRMRDWYDFKDPRQFYYGTYTIARAKQQEGADATIEQVLDEGMADELPQEVRQLIAKVLIPARHLEWGANMNNTFISSYSYGTAINAATIFAAMDRLGIAQNISRIGLIVGGEESLDIAKDAWLNAAEWQGLRRYTENSFVVKDWFELFIAQNLVLDGLLYPFLYTHVAKLAAKSGTPFYGLVTGFMKEWFAENVRWVDAVVKAAVADSPENKALIEGWVNKYQAEATAGLTALAESIIPNAASAVIQPISDDFAVRLKKAGLGA
jgi:phenol hydroxylase P1 protein